MVRSTKKFLSSILMTVMLTNFYMSPNYSVSAVNISEKAKTVGKILVGTATAVGGIGLMGYWLTHSNSYSDSQSVSSTFEPDSAVNTSSTSPTPLYTIKEHDWQFIRNLGFSINASNINSRKLLNTVSVRYLFNNIMGDEHGFQFSDKFFYNTSSFLDQLDVEHLINDERELKRELDAICKDDRGIVQKGIGVDDRYTATGWYRTPGEYFFCDKGWGMRFDHLYLSPGFTYEYKKKLAQVIHSLYLNINNVAAKDVREACVYTFITHGGHCSERAKAIVNTTYKCVSDYILRSMQSDTDNVIFQLYKMKILNEANMSKAKEKDEGVYEFDRYGKIRGNVLGLNEADGRLPGLDDATCVAQFATLKLLSQVAGEYIANNMEDEFITEFLNAHTLQISFDDYCKITGRSSSNESATFKNKILGFHDGDLTSWANGTTSLTMFGIRANLGDVTGYKFEGATELKEDADYYGICYLNRCKNAGLIIFND